MRMTAEIRRFHSPDVRDLTQWTPPDLQDFGILLQVLIGPKGQQGEEAFDFVVCSPAWLLKDRGAKSVIFGSHHILLFEYNFDRLQEALTKLVTGVSGSSWNELAQKLSRYGRWEFEDYTD